MEDDRSSFCVICNCYDVLILVLVEITALHANKEYQVALVLILVLMEIATVY